MAKGVVTLTEPIGAFRGWDIIIDSSGIFLGHRGIKWPHGEGMQAKCYHWRHKAPNLYCTCGIYGMKKKPVGFDHYGPYAIYGETMFWGHYIQHRGGWRAQWAYPWGFSQIGCTVCDTIKPISKARGFLCFGYREKGFSVSFICGDCYPGGPFGHLLVPASYFVEALERAYRLEEIEGRENEARPCGEGRNLHAGEGTPTETETSP